MPRAARSAEPRSEAVVDALQSISRVLLAMTARILSELDVDVTLSQYRALVVLARGPQRTMDLAAELGVQPSTATRMCHRLVRRDLVRRWQRDDDRRVSWLGLTDRGKDLVGATMRRRRDEIEGLVGQIDLPDPHPVTATLAALVAAAGEVPDRQWWTRWAASTSDVPPRRDARAAAEATRVPGRPAT